MANMEIYIQGSEKSLQRHSRKAAFFALLFLVGIVASGCILFDGQRLKDFKGPSWDVPITLPVLAKTDFYLKDGLTGIAESDGELGFNIPITQFEAYEAPVSGALPFSPADPSVDESTLDLGDLSSVPDFDFSIANLKLTVVNQLNVTGRIEVELTGLRNGAPVGATVQDTIDLTDGTITVLNIAAILNEKPEALSVKRTVIFDAQIVNVEAGDKLSLQTDLWIPLTMTIPAGGVVVDVGATTAMELDEGTRSMLDTAPITEVAFFIDAVSRIPFGFNLSFTFADNPDPALDPDKVEIEVSIPAAPLNEVGQVSGSEEVVVRLAIDESLRRKLVAEPVYVAPKMVIPNGAEPQTIGLTAHDSLSFKAYVIITVGMNKNDSR